jgi:hypothetical protein
MLKLAKIFVLEMIRCLKRKMLLLRRFPKEHLITTKANTLQRLNIEHNDINTLIIFKKENTTQKQMYVVSLNGTTDINDIHPILTNITKVIEFNSFKQIDKNIVSKCRELIRNIIDNQSIVNSGICDFIAVWINNVNGSNNIYEQYKNQHLIKTFTITLINTFKQCN